MVFVNTVYRPKNSWLEKFDITCVHRQEFNPLPDYKILDWSKLKQIADDIFKMKSKYH